MPGHSKIYHFADLPIYHGPKSGEFYQFTDLPNLPLPGERSLLSIMPYTVTA